MIAGFIRFSQGFSIGMSDSFQFQDTLDCQDTFKQLDTNTCNDTQLSRYFQFLYTHTYKDTLNCQDSL